MTIDLHRLQEEVLDCVDSMGLRTDITFGQIGKLFRLARLGQEHERRKCGTCAGREPHDDGTEGCLWERGYNLEAGQFCDEWEAKP